MTADRPITGAMNVTKPTNAVNGREYYRDRDGYPIADERGYYYRYDRDRDSYYRDYDRERYYRRDRDGDRDRTNCFFLDSSAEAGV